MRLLLAVRRLAAVIVGGRISMSALLLDATLAGACHDDCEAVLLVGDCEGDRPVWTKAKR